jgi:hypothetical protein
MRGSGNGVGCPRLEGVVPFENRQTSNWRDEMRKILMLAATVFLVAGSHVQAQVPLSAYTGGEHELIMFCKAHPEIRIIQAIAVLLKDERILKGIEMK